MADIQPVKTGRRQFLKWVVVGTGAAALAYGGAGTLVRPVSIEFPEHIEVGTMSETNRVLVAYASRYGSTGEVASFIRGVLADTHGWDVDVRQVADVTDLTPYRAVVVGSPILGSRWLPGAVEFVEGHRDDLARLPTAFFATGLTMREDTEENRRTMRECLAPVSEMVTPADIGLFGGVLESARLGLTMRVLVRLANRPMGDFRNWEAIHNWGVSLGPLLAGDGIG